LRVAATSAEPRPLIHATPVNFAATILPTLELIELPELGAAAEADGPAVEVEEPAPEDEVVDVLSYEERTSLPPILKLVADNDHVDAQAIAHQLEALRHDAVGGGSVDAETVAAETARREDEIHTEVPADVIADAEIIIGQAASDALLAPPHGAKHDIDVRM